MKRRVERPAATPRIASDGKLEGRQRVVIESVSPEIDGGRFAAKRAAGETVTVEADIFADGHDALGAVLRYRHESSASPIEVPMVPLANDRWRGEFTVTELGRYLFTLHGWVDHFETWRGQFAKRVEAGQDVALELELAARMVEGTVARADGNLADAELLRQYAKSLRGKRGAATVAMENKLRKME